MSLSASPSSRPPGTWPVTWPVTWIVTEGLAGTENQCLGVAEALGVTPEVKRVSLRWPWRILSPYLGWERASSFHPPLSPPWPDLLIASGRKSIAASRYIKRASGGRTFTVQIQDPRISPRAFDLVALPRHDPTRGQNVVVTEATPNRVTAKRLEDAGREFADVVSFLPSPRVAVLIGGGTKTHAFTKGEAESLARSLLPFLARGMGLMVTASRRTGAENTEILRRALSSPGCFFWDGTGPNPYMGFLALADFLVVTAESSSMLSEAATTGKPVYVLPMKGLSSRQSLLVRNLTSAGILRPLQELPQYAPYTPLNDAARIAAEIRRKSGLF